MAYFIIIIGSFVALVGAQVLHAVWPKVSFSCHRFGSFLQLSPALVLSMTCLPHAFFPLASQRAIPSFFQFIEAMLLMVSPKYSGTSRKYSANPSHALQTLPISSHVGRRGNNYSPRGWVGGKGKENLSVPPRTITPRVKGTYKHNSSHFSLAVSGTFASKETIDYFRITHNTLCLSPKFGLSYCFHML